MIGTKLAIGLFCTIVVPVFAVWSFSIVTRLALLGFLALEGFYPETTRNVRCDNLFGSVSVGKVRLE
jgi:hypothetical protein